MNSSLKHTNAAFLFVLTFAFMGVVLFAVDIVFRFMVLQFHSDGETVAANFSWMIIQWSFMFPALLIGVYVSVVFTQCRPRRYLISMACIQGLVIVRACIFSPLSSVPTEMWILNFLVVPFFFCYGPWLFVRNCWESKTANIEHFAASLENR